MGSAFPSGPLNLPFSPYSCAQHRRCAFLTGFTAVAKGGTATPRCSYSKVRHGLRRIAGLRRRLGWLRLSTRTTPRSLSSNGASFAIAARTTPT